MEVVLCQQAYRFFYQIRKQALWRGRRGQCELEQRCVCVCVCACLCECVSVCVCVCQGTPPSPSQHPHCHSPKASLLNWLTDNKIIQQSKDTKTFVPQSNSLTSGKAPGRHRKTTHSECSMDTSERKHMQQIFGWRVSLVFISTKLSPEILFCFLTEKLF